MKTRGCLLVLTALSTPLTVSAQPAKPTPNAPAKPKSVGDTLTGQAKTDYDAARVLAGDGDFGGALIKFEAAYDASKDPRLLWNIAACEKQLRHYARAIDRLKQYAADTSTLVTPNEKSEATELISALEPFTVAVTFNVNEPGATIRVDGNDIGTSPLSGPVMLDLGPHKIRVTKDGFRDANVDTAVGGSPQQTILVKIDREVHEGKLSVIAPARATIAVDGKPIAASDGKQGSGVVLTSGGHTLRVTAPGMRVYEREIVIKDNETRAVEVMLEAEAEPEKPKLRVAVGCIDPEPRSTDDGLAVYVDDSPAAATPSGGKTTYRERARSRVEYVEYSMASGLHSVRLKIPSCTSMSATVDVKPQAGADLRGALPSASPELVRGADGNPNWGRAALSLWLPNTFEDYASIGTSAAAARELSTIRRMASRSARGTSRAASVVPSARPTTGSARREARDDDHLCAPCRHRDVRRRDRRLRLPSVPARRT